MTMRVYATSTDYSNLAEEPFEGPHPTAPKLEKRLRSASVEVEKLTRMAIYDIDSDGYPTDPDVSDAFTEATVAIVEYWEETGDPSGAESYAGAIKIGSVSLGTTSSAQADVSTREKLERRIGTKALDILANARLFSQPGY